MTGIASSCTVEGVTEVNAGRKKFLEAWMEVNHPGVEPTGLGIYIIEDIPGTGTAWTEENPPVGLAEKDLLHFLLRYGQEPLEFESDSEYYTPDAE